MPGQERGVSRKRNDGDYISPILLRGWAFLGTWTTCPLLGDATLSPSVAYTWRAWFCHSRLQREIGLYPPTVYRWSMSARRPIPLIRRVIYGHMKIVCPLVLVSWWWNESAMTYPKWYGVRSTILIKYLNLVMVMLFMQRFHPEIVPLSKAWMTRNAGDLRFVDLVMLGLNMCP